MKQLRHWKFPLLIGLLLSISYVYFFGNRAYVELDIQVSETTWFKIYWTDSSGQFSEKRRARIRLHPEQSQYSFFLTNLRGKGTIRIDTHQYIGEATVRQLVISQPGMETIRFNVAEGFDRLEPHFFIESSGVEPEGFLVASSGKDPNFLFQLDPSVWKNYPVEDIWRILFIFAMVGMFFYYTEAFRSSNLYIPLFFTVIMTLVVVMAVISQRNVHPDEYVHLDASKYYMSNWMPPAVDSPDIRHTYSVYGVSRLNNREAAYFFTGKFAKLLEPLKLQEHLQLRMFNLVLFFCILLYLFHRQPARILAAPFLLSPQLWYVFSYCNSDALALTLAFLAVCQITLPDSTFNLFLKSRGGYRQVYRILLLGVLVGALMMLKKNYYFFFLFLGGYVLWRLIFLHEIPWRKFAGKAAVVIVIGGLLCGLRVVADYHVNGMDRSAKLGQLREELATPLYKPSTPLEQKHIFLYRKARGHTLEQLVMNEFWFGKTFRSAFGMYGYFTVSATDSYYHLIHTTGIAFLVFFAGSIMLRGGVPGNTLLLLTSMCAVGLVGASLYHSWTSDFQTQGRYLFPIIPMLGVLLYHTRQYMISPGYRLFLVGMFLLSSYSFINVALLRIPKCFS